MGMGGVVGGVIGRVVGVLIIHDGGRSWGVHETLTLLVGVMGSKISACNKDKDSNNNFQIP